MGDGYTKLFASIVDSTIWQEDLATKVVWITMLAMADRDGYVGASVPGLAARSGVTVEQCREALAKFMAPDPDSRTSDNDGRRVEEAERGWRLLNHAKFRDMRPDGTPSTAATFEREGKVYFVRAGEFIKIGFSQNPWARLNALKTGSPVKPVLLGYVDGTMALERELQTRFKHLRENLEWFRADPELVAFVESVVLPVATGSATQKATGNYNNASASASASASPEADQKEETERDARVDWDFPKRVRSDFIKRYSQANACVPAETMLGKNLPKLIDWINASAALQGVEPIALWVRLADAFFAAGPEATQRFHPSWLCSNPDQWLNPIATGADWKEQAAKTAAVRKLRVADQLRAFRAETDVICTALRVSDFKLAEETRMQREREYSALYKQLHGGG